MSVIRVLHVIGRMNRGGAESMIMSLYRSIDRNRIQFDFVENYDREAAYDEEIRSLGGRIYHCPYFSVKTAFQYRSWWKRFFCEHEGEYSIIHGHLGSTAAIYLDEAKKRGLYTIAHSHSSGTDHSVKALLYKLLSYNTRNIADYFFACSEAAGRDRYGAEVVSSDHYHMLQNAIDTSLFRYDPDIRAEYREKMGLDKAFTFGHIGRYTGEKNQRFILEIFSELSQRLPDTRLVMVGDGPMRADCMEYARELGIEDHVIFTGVRSDVNCLIQAMDYFIFPSLYEGLPVTLVEIQTSGLPGVMSDKVPRESILIDELLTVMPLSDDRHAWSDHIISHMHTERVDRSDIIREKGFDVQTTAKWLEDYYCDRCNAR